MYRYHLLCVLLLVGCFQNKTEQESLTEKNRWKTHSANTEIIRDDFGVPHIFGKTDADAVFGLLYAQCEDDFNRVEQNYIWAIGRLAEVEGEEALYSDLRTKLFMTQKEAEDQFSASPVWLQKLCIAFADGINFYLSKHPEIKPKLLTHFEPWMPMYFSEGSIGGDIERVATKKIKAFYEDGASIPTLQNSKMQAEKILAEPKGSNGIAISGKLTQSGYPLLLINPHTSFYFRGEAHVVSEEGLNAYGAITWGQFFVYQGFNERTGWMHTSTYTDVMDEYKEQIVRMDGKLYYQYGEELRPVDSTEVALKYLKGTQIAEKRFPIYRTHHGPITHIDDSLWTSTAMMWEPAKALEQSYTRTKQEGYKGFRHMMDIRTNSSNNTVYADAEGNIAYFHGNFIPVRDTSFDYTHPLDGSNPSTDWKGLHTVDESITLLNPQNGWIQNCNSTPYTAALEFSPKKRAYPRYMSVDLENFRGIHAIGLLTNRQGYTLDSLIKLAYDPYLPAFKALIPGLVAAYDQSGRDKTLKEPIEVLRTWNYETSEVSVAMTLAHYYGTMYYQQGHRPPGLSPTALVEYWGNLSPREERLQIFEKSIAQLRADFGTWNKPWGDVNRFQRLNGNINQDFSDDAPSLPIGFASGRWGALASFGTRYGSDTKKIYGTSGNSFVAVVEFGDKLRAKSILAGGQSSDINSPHFFDQAQRYADGNFKEVAFYREDVLKRSTKRYHPGEEH
jgi:acyl-homoserine lactone acylase PvdQ